MAQELLQTFSEELGGVTLVPGTGGIYHVTVRHEGQDTLIWDRKAENGFPQPKVIKQRLRDVIDPDLALGHVDRGLIPSATAEQNRNLRPSIRPGFAPYSPPWHRRNPPPATTTFP